MQKNNNRDMDCWDSEARCEQEETVPTSGVTASLLPAIGVLPQHLQDLPLRIHLQELRRRALICLTGVMTVF